MKKYATDMKKTAKIAKPGSALRGSGIGGAVKKAANVKKAAFMKKAAKMGKRS